MSVVLDLIDQTSSEGTTEVAVCSVTVIVASVLADRATTPHWIAAAVYRVAIVTVVSVTGSAMVHQCGRWRAARLSATVRPYLESSLPRRQLNKTSKVVLASFDHIPQR